jgi:ribosomal protein L24
VLTEKNKAIVEGVNMVSNIQAPQGGIVKKEAYSNI